jgi:hypothetical protein
MSAIAVLAVAIALLVAVRGWFDGPDVDYYPTVGSVSGRDDHGH